VFSKDSAAQLLSGLGA